MIRFPVWFECDKCGEEEDGDYRVQSFELRRPDVPTGWHVLLTGDQVKLLCPKCRKKAGF